MILTLFLATVVAVLLYHLPLYAMKMTKAARLTSKIPGPAPWPIIGNVLELGFTPVDILINGNRLFSTYGSIVRAWMGPVLYIFLSDPKDVEVILTSNVNIRKNMNYKFLEPFLGTGLLTSTGKKWKHHRKILTPTFHFKILDEFIDVFNSNGNVLIENLKKRVGVETNIYQHMTLCALDVICEAAMGVKMNVQKNQNSEYVNSIVRFADIVVKRSLSPWLFPDFLFNISSSGREQRECVKILHDMSNTVIANRRKELELRAKDSNNHKDKEEDVGQKKRLAFLDLLLNYNKEGGDLTDEDIREEVDTFMFEGHDTTASGLSFCVWLLSQHPDVQEKVYDELYGIFGDSDRELNSEDLTNMKYLECVIKEALRLYPSVPFIFRELDESVKIDEHELVPGTTIMIAPFYINRNSTYFPDPEKFDPDRFLPENARGRHPYTYVPFSAGPRNCIGQKFALMEMKSVISKMVRNFKLSASPKKLVLSYEVILRSEGGIHIRLENRK